MKKLIAVLSLMLAGAMAHAEAAGPVWACQLETGSLEGRTFSFLITKTTMTGEGTVTCAAPGGAIAAPVNVKIESLGVGLVFGEVFSQNTGLVGVGLGIANPNYIFGTYPGAKVSASFIIPEAALSLNFGANQHGVGLGVDFIGNEITSGFRVGAAVEGWTLTITPKATEPNEPNQPWEPVPQPNPAPTPAN